MCLHLCLSLCAETAKVSKATVGQASPGMPLWMGAQHEPPAQVCQVYPTLSTSQAPSVYTAAASNTNHLPPLMDPSSPAH